MRAARYILHRVSSSSSQDTQPMFTYVREDFHVRGTRVSRVKIVRTQILSSGYAELRDLVRALRCECLWYEVIQPKREPKDCVTVSIVALLLKPCHIRFPRKPVPYLLPQTQPTLLGLAFGNLCEQPLCSLLSVFGAGGFGLQPARKRQE